MGIYLCALLCLCGHVGKVSETSRIQQKTSGGYCGIYCLYAAMRSFGVKADPNGLIRPEYIGSPQGSSLAELKKAAQANGLYAVPVSRLSTGDLTNLSSPFILHVKSAPDMTVYDHYFLFLGSRQGKALIYDPPNPIEQVEFWILSPRWDGSGLLVSDRPINLSKVFAPARKRFIIFAAIAVAIIFGIRFLRRYITGRIKDIRRTWLFVFSLLQGIGLVTAALLTGLLFHVVSDTGFLAHANATVAIRQTHLANFLPKLYTSDIQRKLPDGTIFIDARYQQDYTAGHIEGAINIPITLGDKERSTALSKIAKNAKIVVYCQSAGCKFAETVAVKLYSDGFTNISIYKDGWQQWQSKQIK